MSASATAFPLGIYVGTPNGNDPAAEQNFETQYNSFVQTMGGSRPMFMNTYVDLSSDPSTWGSNASWNAWSWTQSGKNYVGPGSGVTPVVGVPMSTNDGGWSNIDQFYQQIISGQYDADYKAIVDAWAQQGYSTIDLRLGYEFNGTFMPWSPYDTSAPNAAADFVTSWQHLADVVHAEGKVDGVTVNTVWNPNGMGWNQTPTSSLYPGDQYVDNISLDLYSHTWPSDLTDWASGGTTQDNSATQWASNAANRMHYWQYPDASFWNPTGTGAGWSLQNTIDFAKAHGKPISMSETGAGGNGAGLGLVDDPAFPQWLAGDLAKAQAEGVSVSYVNIWDLPMGDGNWMFSGPGANKPLEAEAWGKYFGAGSGNAVSQGGGSPPPSDDTLVLNLSADLWQGSPQFIVSVDGNQQSGPQSVTALHSAGRTQAFDFTGMFGSGQHDVAISFINDAYAGTPQTDRNLYVNSIDYNGQHYGANSATLYSNGTEHFTVG